MQFHIPTNPIEFEYFISDIFKKLGFIVQVTPQTNDKGKDIILEKGDLKYLVECKRYNSNNQIGRPDIQKFFAAIIEENAKGGFFVTTSSFSESAIEYVKKISTEKGIHIELVDRKQLEYLIKSNDSVLLQNNQNSRNIGHGLLNNQIVCSGCERTINHNYHTKVCICGYIAAQCSSCLRFGTYESKKGKTYCNCECGKIFVI